MREIKFRAWDGKQMTTSGIMFNTSTGCVEVPKEASFGGSLTFKYVLMQFTGLKDKNGKEIYEGDIMGWESYEGTKNQVRWVVEFNDKSGFRSWSSTKNDEIVLGNIYENPELLK